MEGAGFDSVFESVPEVRGLPSAGVTRVQQYCAPVRLPSDPPPQARGELDGALVEIERALMMSPNLALAHWRKGATLIFSGRPKEGLVSLETCIRLDPRDPFMSERLLHTACGLYFAREYEGVIDAAKRLIRLGQFASSAQSMLDPPSARSFGFGVWNLRPVRYPAATTGGPSIGSATETS